jgi:hypothetical protein
MEKMELILPELICGKSIEEIRGMRMKHGHLFVVAVRDGENTHYAVCKEPTMEVIDAVQSMGKTSEVKGAMTLYDNCVVLVEDEIKRRDMLKLQVSSSIAEKISQLGASIKNV